MNTTHPFLCPICTRSFRVKQLMLRHIPSHSEKRPFMCSFCTNTYKYSKGMKRHVRLAHSKEAKMREGEWWAMLAVGEDQDPYSIQKVFVANAFPIAKDH